jgi:hypothetical protein
MTMNEPTIPPWTYNLTGPPKERCEGRVRIGDDRYGGFVQQCELPSHTVNTAHRVTYDACEPEAALRWYGTYEGNSDGAT